MSHGANSVVNGTTAFLRSRQPKWGVTWCFDHVTPLVLSSILCDDDIIINDIIASPGSRWSKWGTTWLFLVMWPNNVVYMLTPHYCTYRCKKCHQTSIFIFHVINIHVPTTNMTLKYHRYVIYANYFMCTYETTMSVSIPHMDSMQSTISPQALVYNFTLLPYAPEQICLQ